jgi:hypothetical protein
MAYTINLTDGSVFATVADGTINTTSSMTLVGKNYAGYGEFLDENFIHLLENGSNTTAPGAPLVGQLWWDKTNNVMKVWNGATFKTISAATASSTQPASNVTGDLWFNTVAQQLYVWNGTAFILVGPASTAGQGTSGAVVATVTDGFGSDHVVVEFYTANTIVAIASQDPTFTPAAPITGFATVGPGLQLSSSVSSALFRGTSTNAQLLDGLDSLQFMRTDINTSTAGTLAVNSDSGLTVGVDNDAKIAVNTANSLVTLSNQTLNANLRLQVNAGGSATTALTVNGANAAVSIPTILSVTGNVTAPLFIGNVLGNVTGNVTGNVIGNVTASGSNTQVQFNDGGIFGGATGFTFNKTTGAVTITGNITAGNITTSGITSLTSITKTGANGVGNIGSSTNSFGTIFASTAVVPVIQVDSIVKTGANGVGNIGSSTSVFNTVFARATSALYADVAERFAADTVIAPGTVVELGGSAEITVSREPLSEQVFGVISSQAAYLMNSGAGDDRTHPPVAMTGRVPVRVIGAVSKGDRLVSAGDGLARAAKPGEATPFNTIGRALVDKSTQQEGMVEAIVTIK